RALVAPNDPGAAGGRLGDIRAPYEVGAVLEPPERRSATSLGELWALHLPLSHQHLEAPERGIRRRLLHRFPPELRRPGLADRERPAPSSCASRPTGLQRRPGGRRCTCRRELA